MPHRILISGSLAYDRIMDFPGRFRDHIMSDKIHALSVSFAVRSMHTHFGGTAGNIAYSLRLLGDTPLIFSQAGADFAPYRAWCARQGIATGTVRIIPRLHTASAYIITDRDDNQITALHLETMSVPYGITRHALVPHLPVSCAIVAPGNVMDMCAAAKTYRALGIKYLVDPGQQIPVLTGMQLITMIRGADALLGNDYEVGLMLKKMKKTRIQLLAMVKCIVITLGAKGSKIYQGTSAQHIAAVKAKRFVDPTGAGDAYRAGFIYGYVRGALPAVCGVIAARVAARAVEQRGTQQHRLTGRDRAAIAALLRRA